MSVDPIDDRTLATLFAWWEARGDGVPPVDVLPALGRVVMDEDGPAAAAYLYTPPGCRVAILDWLVTRPGMSAGKSRRACRRLLADLECIARESGATLLFASVFRPRMAAEACAAGFTIAATDCIHLVKPL